MALGERLGIGDVECRTPERAGVQRRDEVIGDDVAAPAPR